ncbi:LuxR family transcriptional regulator [Citrobacter koseri]|uniref:LuxR family transcriptional regulator n=1 Tax=Citrobacter koseri TaxID=545 RepID=A0A447UG90_CITKO|nr:LuxR family transcriptional regulator [Citrobacter koseri]
MLEMRFRAPRLMIGLVDKKHIPARGEIPSCIGNIVFVPLNASVSKISKVIKQHWFSLQQAKTPHAVHHCGIARIRRLPGNKTSSLPFFMRG